jgi:hypothetical protein
VMFLVNPDLKNLIQLFQHKSNLEHSRYSQGINSVASSNNGYNEFEMQLEMERLVINLIN